MNVSRSPTAVASQHVDFACQIWIQQQQSRMARQKTTQTHADAEKKSKEEASRASGKTPLHQKASPQTVGSQKCKRPWDQVKHLSEITHLQKKTDLHIPKLSFAR